MHTMQCATMHTMHAQRPQAGLPGDIESRASALSLVVNTAMCNALCTFAVSLFVDSYVDPTTTCISMPLIHLTEDYSSP